MPFSEAAFLDVFGAYNARLWPAVAALWIVTAWVAVRSWRHGHGGREWLLLMALHWVWSGAVYHAMFFRPINAAAAGFAVLFVLQGAAFAWLFATTPVRMGLDRSWRSVIGAGLVVYALAYPLVGLACGMEYPRVPLFAVPCPTTIMTTGLLVASTGLPRWIGVGPALWSAIGSSAALALGVVADVALVACVVVLLLDMAAPRFLGPRLMPGPQMTQSPRPRSPGSANAGEAS